ncbi:MAG: glycosyltransferase family 4 protein [Candidatus Binatia bacterium]|nr:glycosyltransferase family 4 protein [Candidatus Binatia bacterium]
MKAIIIINEDFSAWKLRGNLIRELVARGVDVAVACPTGDYISHITELGARHIPLPMYRFTSPAADLKLCRDIYTLVKREQPDIVHTMSIKPNTFGAIAAKLAGAPRVVALVCGLGFAFQSGGGLGQRIQRQVAVALYRLAGRTYDGVWFANPDDLELFVDLKVVSRDRALLTKGEGVNIQRYSPDEVGPDATARLRSEFDIPESCVIVLMMVARVVWPKGVRQFVETGKLARDWGIPTHFLLVGPMEPESPDAVPPEYLEQNAGNNLTHVGFRSDVRELIALADIVTLPSFYREGCPLVLIEGLAMGKPIVTTDHVGCRQVVEEGENGFLVPIEDTDKFSTAVRTLAFDPFLRRNQGIRSREKARREFADELVMTQVMTQLYGLAPRQAAASGHSA